MSERETPREHRVRMRAETLRYKRAALQLAQRDNLLMEIEEISETCENLAWSVGDDEKLHDVFDGDTDAIHEFRFRFSDLSARCSRLYEELREGYVTEHFDDFFVGTLGNRYKTVGYDTLEEDYFELTRYQAEVAQTVSGKRLMVLTKETLIAVAGQCFGVMLSFIDVRHQYDCMKSVLDALHDERAELLRNVRDFNTIYNNWQDNIYNMKLLNEFDSVVSRFPDRCWVE